MNTAEALDHLAQTHGTDVSQWTGPLRPQLAELEARLHAVGDGELANIAGDLFAAGGKRLRPLAALVVSRALGVPEARAVRVAEVVELTHGATLLHDDVIDEADIRRGRPAARVRWNNTLAILGGDYVLVRALRLAAALESPAVMHAHHRALEELVAAEVAQHLARAEFDLSTEGYLAVAEGKTGSLFAFAASAPALLQGADSAAGALDRFGREVGVAFQVADDLRDLLGTDSTKPTGLDLCDGVLSLPLRLAGQKSDTFRRQLHRAVGHGPCDDCAGGLAREARESAAVEDAVAIGRDFLTRGRNALNEVDANGLEPLFALCGWLDYELARALEVGS
jgi:geranylgeranyl pyrophosphate synthase